MSAGKYKLEVWQEVHRRTLVGRKLERTLIWWKCAKTSIFFAFFLKRQEVLWKFSVGGNLKKISVGGNLGRTSPDGFEIANHLICDASCSTGREEEEEDEKSKEEDIKISSKSSKTSAGCWPECIHLLHQTIFFVSQPQPSWVCSFSEDREYVSFEFRKIDSNQGILFYMTGPKRMRTAPKHPGIFFFNLLKRFWKFLGRFSVAGNFETTTVGGNLKICVSNWLKLVDIVSYEGYFYRYIFLRTSWDPRKDVDMRKFWKDVGRQNFRENIFNWLNEGK